LKATFCWWTIKDLICRHGRRENRHYIIRVEITRLITGWQGSRGAEEVDGCGDVEGPSLPAFFSDLFTDDWRGAFYFSSYISLYNRPTYHQSLCLLSRIMRNWGPPFQPTPLLRQSQHCTCHLLRVEVLWLCNWLIFSLLCYFCCVYVVCPK
jgi:hypothetical protein